MSLESVLLDQARLLRKAASASKVGGRTSIVDTEPGTWFSARLQMPVANPEAFDAARVSRRVVLVPTLIFATEDDDGNPVEVRYDDMLEVESDDLGSTTWQVAGHPEPFRKREGVIGFQVSLKRIEAREFAPKV